MARHKYNSVFKQMARHKYNSVFKQKIIDDYDDETTQSELCEKYKMSKAIINQLVKKI